MYIVFLLLLVFINTYYQPCSYIMTPIVAIIMLYFYYSSKSIYLNYFDSNFYDLIDSYGIECEIHHFSAFTSSIFCIPSFYHPVLYLYENSMIVQFEDKAIYINNLSSTIKIFINIILLNFFSI